MYETRIDLGLMMTAGLHSISSRVAICSVHLRWPRDSSRVNWDEFVHYQRRASAVYAEAMRQFSVRSRDVLMNAQCPHKWWSILKSAVLAQGRIRLFLLLLGTVMVCESVGKADVMSAYFDGKQSRDPVDLPST